jgi:quinoprotein glucose dehydrogenase
MHLRRKTFGRDFLIILALLQILLVQLPASSKGKVPRNKHREWKTYGGGLDNIHYSTLDQITRNNVQKLEVAWTFDTGDAFQGSEMQCNPIVVNGVLFATTPKLRVIALGAATGKLLWSFNPDEGSEVKRLRRNRGITYWEDGGEERIYFVAKEFLYALNARTGRLVSTFGVSGRVDLREGLNRDPQGVTISATSPGVVYKDLLILGSIASEDLPSPPGDIRAYDVRTGKLRWSFHTIPHPGEFGYQTWPKDAWTYSGGANNWCGMSLDEQRGLLFVPTGSAAFDFYGANRLGDNLFANCLIALKAETGERVWHFQTVKHDVWDRDLPAPPSLVTVRRDGRSVDAVAQITKSGYIFLFERETGKPLFPIEHHRFAVSDVEGEVLSETQPLPIKPLPFSRQSLTEEMVTKRTPEAHEAVLSQFRRFRSAGQFTPPSLEGTVIFPGFDGGGEWGGGSFDPETGLFYVNANEMPWILKLVPRPPRKSRTSSRDLYLGSCASCHRGDLHGSPPEFPSLVGIGQKLTEVEIKAVIREGSGRMPGFVNLPTDSIEAISRYIISGQETDVETPTKDPLTHFLKYRHDGYNKFLDPEGYPAVQPPWGTLNAIDLNRGETVWKIPFGEFPELVKLGIRNTGSENYGGSVVTAGGILFIGATNHDKKFHAFDKSTGKLLWETTLPAAGNATPAVFEVEGRQFVVIAAGGGKWGLPSGGTYVAFALPKHLIPEKEPSKSSKQGR